MRNTFKKQSGFALVYTILFLMLVMLTVLTIWATGMADVRLSHRNEASSGAYQLARSAIDDGWAEYQEQVDNAAVPASPFGLPNVGACPTNSTNPTVHRYYLDTKKGDDVPLNTTIKVEQSQAGFYAYRICDTMIEGIGYLKGNKITLKAEVDHTGDTNIYDELGAKIGVDHSKDFITVYQSGPT